MLSKIYIHPRCSSCKKALSFIKKNHIKVEEVDLLEKAPTKSELKKMLKAYGGEIKKLFNTSGKLYREQKVKEKLPSMSETEAIELLASNPMLIKRPFLLSDKVQLVGYKEEQWKQMK